jgi:hypothetical protein
MTSPREQAIEAAKVIEMVEQLDKLEERYELIFDELAPLPGNRSAFTKASVSLVLDARERYHDSLAEAWPTIRELLLRDARARLDGAKMMMPRELPADVVELVISARIVAYEDQSKEALRDLDKAAEAFSERVPWENDPEERAMHDATPKTTPEQRSASNDDPCRLGPEWDDGSPDYCP